MNIVSLQTQILIKALKEFSEPEGLHNYLLGESFSEEAIELIFNTNPISVMNKEISSLNSTVFHKINATNILSVQVKSGNDLASILELQSAKSLGDTSTVCVDLSDYEDFEENHFLVQALSSSIDLTTASDIHFYY